MLAQRSDAPMIDAVEIDEKSLYRMHGELRREPMGRPLVCYHASFQEFALEIDEVYDLIISNPPFYTADYKTAEKSAQHGSVY